MSFEFVQATESDKGYLLSLRKLTMSQHLDAAGLLLSADEHVQRLNYKYECSYLVFHKNSKIGLVKFEVNEHELELIQIQVEPRFQGNGFGSGIVKKIIDLGKDKTIRLSVLKTNPAIQLYERLGFVVIGEDKYEYHMQFKH